MIDKQTNYIGMPESVAPTRPFSPFPPFSAPSYPKKTTFIAKSIIQYNGSLWEFSRKISTANAEEKQAFEAKFTKEISSKGTQLLKRLQQQNALEQSFRIFPPRSPQDHSFQVCGTKSHLIEDQDLASHLFQLSKSPLCLRQKVSVAPIGFKNCGNSCHLSSVMTVLTTNEFFRTTLLKESKFSPLTDILRKYEKQVQQQNFQAIDLQDLSKTLGFEGNQEDWDETFLKVIKRANLPKNSDLHAQILQRSFTTTGAISESLEDPTIARIIVTLPENLNSHSLEPLIDTALHADIEKGKTIDDGHLLQKQFQTFKKSPPVLLISVNRWNRERKRNDPVQFPYEFPLYQKPLIEGVESGVFHGRYALRAIAFHSGSTAKSGHYTTGVRTQDGVCWECSDSSVTSKSEKDLQNKSESTYVFIYNRIS